MKIRGVLPYTFSVFPVANKSVRIKNIEHIFPIKLLLKLESAFQLFSSYCLSSDYSNPKPYPDYISCQRLRGSRHELETIKIIAGS